MVSTIIRRLTKEDGQRVLSYKLAMVVTKESERILIGTEEDIKRHLGGQKDVELEYDTISVLLRVDSVRILCFRKMILELLR